MIQLNLNQILGHNNHFLYKKKYISSKISLIQQCPKAVDLPINHETLNWGNHLT